MSAAPVLFLTHDPDRERSLALPGTLAAHAVAAGLAVDVRRVTDPRPAPSDVSMLVVMGSAAAAYDDSLPWLAGELDYVRSAVAADVPVLGVCFGGQVLSRALGGEVSPAPVPEIGFVDVASDDPSLVAPGPWMEFHYDRFTVPPGATAIASSANAVQAFTHGVHLGVQFHPEISPTVLATWQASWDASSSSEASSSAVSASGGAGVARVAEGLARIGIDLDDVRLAVKEREEVSAERSRVLLEAFRRRAGLAGRG